MKSKPLACLLATTAASLSVLAAETPALDPHLEPLQPWLDKTWKGEFKNSTPDKPIVDVARWERALNGQAVRILHSINDGVYGGEILVTWDSAKQQLGFHYFTTAGFSSVGTFRIDGNKLLTHEIVTGNREGVTEVKAENELRPDGTFHVKSEHLKDGKWVPGHEATYRPDPTATVVFR